MFGCVFERLTSDSAYCSPLHHSAKVLLLHPNVWPGISVAEHAKHQLFSLLGFVPGGSDSEGGRELTEHARMATTKANV